LKKQHKKPRNVRRKPLRTERKKPPTEPVWRLGERINILKRAAETGAEEVAALLGELQWDAEAGDQVAAEILARHRADLQAGLEAGHAVAAAVMAAWGERPTSPQAEEEDAEGAASRL
jgi:hypothetical protein